MPKALISMYKKPGIEIFVKQLVELGWEIVSSGGTAEFLRKAGIQVQDVAELVGGGAILGHRVVTLSREVHAGLLARHIVEDVEEMESLGLPFIGLVCVGMYPLQAEIANFNSTPESVREKTDIGGPAMLRSGAKGRRIVISNPTAQHLQTVIDWLKAGQPEADLVLVDMAADAEGTVATYCLDSARYISGGRIDGMVGTRVAECRYGENACQTPAGLFTTGTDDPLALDKFQLVAGAAPSYNNYCDIDRLLQTTTHIAVGLDANNFGGMYHAVGVKHGNPCGAAVSEDPANAVKMMLEGDLRAIMGGLVMLNFPVGEAIAELLLTHSMDDGQRRLLDGIIAPSFEDGAVEMLRRKGDKCRFLANPALLNLNRDSLDGARRFRYVRGGFLAQPNYTYVMSLSGIGADPRAQIDLILAWAVGSTSNSNTITLVKFGQLIGNGVGQQDRVGGCKLALTRARDAGHDPRGAVAYSDSFFPFPDGPELLIEAGVSAVLATSGSVRDQEVRNVFEEAGVDFYTIPDSEGRGFFGH